MSLDPAAVQALRRSLKAAGYVPVPLYNPDVDTTTGGDPIPPGSRGKVPMGAGWQQGRTAVLSSRALNTGIATAGLQAIDVDVDDAALVRRIVAMIELRLGEAPTRTRANSPRVTLLYRAPDGMQPAKRARAGSLGKVEVLGRGQQTLSFGIHPSGAELEWRGGTPGERRVRDLPIARYEDVAALLEELAPLLGEPEAQPDKPGKARKASTANGRHPPSKHGSVAEIFAISAAMAEIPNDGPPDWWEWNNVGLALYAATEGSDAGRDLWHAWSKRHPAYDAAATDERWAHYPSSPPEGTGAGRLFHMAREARAARSAAEEASEAATDPPEPPKQEAPPPGGDRILTGAAFVARHVPPVWLIDGVVQRSRLYACTSLTGHGKTAVWLFNACMIHAGRMIGQRDVFQGNALVLAGENPADVEARLIGMARAFGIPHDRLPYVLPGSFPLTEEAAEVLRKDIAALGVPLALIVGDTASSYFPGDDENDNVQAGCYARTLRSFTECPGNPALVALCHPTKSAARGNLLPRGGGAFLNELDGNLAAWSHSPGEVTELHWCGKIRGPDFAAIGYRLRSVPTGLTDERDRPEVTIVAEPMSEEAVANHTKQAMANDDAVLRALRDHPDWSFSRIAKETGWVSDDGTPEKWRVQRAVQSLADDRLIQQPRRGAAWVLTDKGEKAIAEGNP